MRVLMLNYEFPPIGGGAANANRYLLAEYAGDHDLTVDLVTSSPGDYRETFPADNITLYRLDVGKQERHFWRMSEIARWTAKAFRKARMLASRYQYDVCHSWTGWPAGLIAYHLRDRIPYIIALRGTDIPGYNPRLERLDRHVFSRLSRPIWRRASHVTVNCEYSATMARETLDRSFEVIHNGVDTDRFNPAWEDDSAATASSSSPDTAEGPLEVLYVGRLLERKGLDHLLEAVADVLRDDLSASLRVTIVGSGTLEDDLRARAAAEGLDDAVTFTGSKPHEQLSDIYRKHDVFVLPSLSEALSNVVLEAIASGLAIITTDTGPAELIDGNGIVIEPGSTCALSAAIRRYLHDPELVEQHRHRSAAIARNLSWDAFADYHRDLYRSAASGSRMTADPPARIDVDKGVRDR